MDARGDFTGFAAELKALTLGERAFEVTDSSTAHYRSGGWRKDDEEEDDGDEEGGEYYASDEEEEGEEFTGSDDERESSVGYVTAQSLFGCMGELRVVVSVESNRPEESGGSATAGDTATPAAEWRAPFLDGLTEITSKIRSLPGHAGRAEEYFRHASYLDECAEEGMSRAAYVTPAVEKEGSLQKWKREVTEPRLRWGTANFIDVREVVDEGYLVPRDSPPLPAVMRTESAKVSVRLELMPPPGAGHEKPAVVLERTVPLCDLLRAKQLPVPVMVNGNYVHTSDGAYMADKSRLSVISPEKLLVVKPDGTRTPSTLEEAAHGTRESVDGNYVYVSMATRRTSQHDTSKRLQAAASQEVVEVALALGEETQESIADLCAARYCTLKDRTDYCTLELALAQGGYRTQR